MADARIYQDEGGGLEGMVPVTPFADGAEQAHYFAGMVTGAAIVSGRDLWSALPADTFWIEDPTRGLRSSPIDRGLADTLPKLATMVETRLREIGIVRSAPVGTESVEDMARMVARLSVERDGLRTLVRTANAELRRVAQGKPPRTSKVLAIESAARRIEQEDPSDRRTALSGIREPTP